MSQLEQYRRRAKEREQRVNSYTDLFVERMRSFRRRLLIIAAEGVAGMSIDAVGRMNFTIENIQRANRVGVQIQAAAREESRGLLEWIIKRFVNLFTSNKKYVSVFAQQAGTIDDRVRRKILLQYGYDERSGLIIPGGYLDAALTGNYTQTQAVRQIQTAIAARVPLDTFRNQFRKDFVALTNAQFDRFTFDLFQEFDRTIAWEYAQELGFDHALYAGTLVRDSREFCIKRVNLIYTLDEINSWNDLNWQGKRPGDVKVVLGGYRCRHTLNWITREFAELLAKQRGFTINSYNKVTPKQRKIKP